MAEDEGQFESEENTGGAAEDGDNATDEGDEATTRGAIEDDSGVIGEAGKEATDGRRRRRRGNPSRANSRKVLFIERTFSLL
ncbi:hypothetical protein DFQ29_009058 [Apophysomyces sp. BC1021]|nr:hypothetical protein DFQ29_009058 [Apophysomyces sp. BC1021]